MKKIIAVMCLMLIGCSNTVFRVPEGYKTCRTDYDCAEGSYCGFVGVDTYAVCRK